MLKSKGNVRDEPDDDGDIGFNDEVVDEPVEVNVLALSDDDDGNCVSRNEFDNDSFVK